MAPNLRLLALAALSAGLVCACGTWIHGSDEAPPPSSELVKDPRAPRQLRSGRIPRKRRDPAAPSASPSVAAPVSTTAPVVASDLDAVRVLQRSLLSTKPLSLAPATNPSRVLSLALDSSVRGETEGLTQDGPILEATLEEGQLARTERATLDAPACVTIVAQGGLGVVELDLFVLTGDASAPRILAEDRRGGPTAVIGGKDGCFPLDRGAETEIVALVRKGSGPILVERFRKP